MTAPFMTEKEFLKEIYGIPHMFYLRFYELEKHLEEKFGYLEDWEIETDGEYNGTVTPDIVEYVRKVTVGSIIDIEIGWSEEQSYDGSCSEHIFVIYTSIDEQKFTREVVDCLFLADECGAIGPLFFPDWFGLEARAEYHHYKEEEEAAL